MGIKEDVKRLIQEAELYQKQGLLTEARMKYDQASDLIRRNDKIKNREKILAGLAKKINMLEVNTSRVEKGPTSPELSAKAQDLIQKLFSFSSEDNQEDAELEGAIALAKFGQFERALKEFNQLINREMHRVVAAKNILRCHIAIASEKVAIEQYEKWAQGDLFSPEQLESVRAFLDQILKNKGIDHELKPVVTKPEPVVAEQKEEEFIDISSIGIPFDSGPGKGTTVEFDVNFQSGNLLSLIISKKDEKLIEGLDVDVALDDLQFYSPIAIFNGSGVVAAKSQIKSGPKQGDFCLDIKITNT
jgi:tetratricopeptide (TPR) repeat protein